MNSDPHENAAWRAFGMLDADEVASFDEALRHDPELESACREMDRLATAVAVTAVVPITPQAGQLARLQIRLGINVPKHTNWFGISGWAAAAVLTLVLALQRGPGAKHTPVVVTQPGATISTQPGESVKSPVTGVGKSRDLANQPGFEKSENNALSVEIPETDGKAVAKVESKRLIQEIEVLRGKLENFQKRDRQRFEPVPGMAWPVVMRMSPPGEPVNGTGELALNKDDTPIIAMLGDAVTAAHTSSMMSLTAQTLRANMATSGNLADQTNQTVPATTAMPSAVPIYDAARDSGTLVVSNLPQTTADESYNLWVRTDAGGNPIYVGRLPKSTNQGAESFDFSLGSTGIMPSGFLLTRDLPGASLVPSASNTILQGP